MILNDSHAGVLRGGMPVIGGALLFAGGTDAGMKERPVG